MVESLRWAYFAVIFAIGIYAVYTDINYGIVKNSSIRIGLITALSLHFISSFFTNAPLLSIFLSLIVSCVVAFAIWYFKFWAAGDAKLFILFSFLIPIQYYSFSNYAAIFMVFVLLGNILILAMIYFVLDDFIRLVKERSNSHGAVFKKVSEFKNYVYNNRFKFLKVVWGYFCLFELVRLLASDLSQLISSMPILSSFSYLILFLIYRPLSVLLGKPKRIVWLPTVLFFSYITIHFLRSGGPALREILASLKYFILFMILIYIANRFIGINKRDVRKINIKKLRPYMQLTEKSIDLLKSQGLGEFYPDGLTQEQAARIRTIWPSISLSSASIEIYLTFPFAPFIFFGTLVTIIIKTSLLRVLRL